MGLINYNPQLDDDYSSEVIRLARERSPDIDAWMVEQRYLQETHEENLSPLWLRNRIVIKICDELNQMGVRIHKEPDDICDDPKLVYTVLMLRMKFDDDHLFGIFRDHLDLLEQIRGDLTPDALVDIITWCRRYLPLDDGWELLNDVLTDQPGLIDGETEIFLKRLKEAFERVDRLGLPDVTVEVNEEVMTRYIRFIGKRNDYITDLADRLWCKLGSTEFEQASRRRLIHNVIENGLEKHLGSRACMVRVLPKFEGVNLHDLMQVYEFLKFARAPYKKLWANCLDYYAGTEKIKCPYHIQVLILATLVVDCPHPTGLDAHIAYELDQYLDVLGCEAIDALKAEFKVLLQNLVNPLELNYVE